MTMKARLPNEVGALFDEYLKGRVIRGLHVHGVNSLKTMDPPMTALVGERLISLTVTSETSFTLATEVLALSVDLQRTGSLRWVPDLAPWTLGEPSMPTGQLFLTASGGVNFVEPGKTKRVTFRLQRAAGPI